MEENKSTEKKKKKSVRRIASDIIMVCLAAIVVISGWKVYTIMHNYKVNRDIYKKVNEVAQPEGFTGDIDFDALHEINKDVVAWIYYEGTNIDYPIVQGSDNDYYLHITVDGNWAVGGTLFVDAVTEKPFEQFNTIVYGHHMQDGSMFGDIKKLKDPEYAAEHPQLELITPEGKYHLLICAFLNQPSDSEIYKTNYDEEDIEGKQGYIDMVNSLAAYTTDEKMKPDDRLVILSTCAYEYQNARYMVVCKMTPWE